MLLHGGKFGEFHTTLFIHVNQVSMHQPLVSPLSGSSKEFILLKVIKVENVWFATISFFNNGFKFQDYVCNLLNVNKSNIAIITVKSVDYCCIIHNISKSEAINSLKNSALENHGI